MTEDERRQRMAGESRPEAPGETGEESPGESGEEVLRGALADAVAALPREREPGMLLEERTVRRLRAEGVVREGAGAGLSRTAGSAAGASGHAAGRAAERGHRRGWLAAGVAAALALFAGGVATGQWLGARQAATTLAAQQQATRAEMSALVQQTGGAWIEVLSRLAEADAGAAAASDGARDAAIRVLHQAANEVVRLAPDDPVSASILQGFDHAALQQTPVEPGERRRQIVWF